MPLMQFTLTYSIYSVILPSPEFDDQLERKYRRLVRESRGKELIVAPKSGYFILATYNTFEYKFKYIPESIKQNLIKFLDVSVAQLVTITDYNNVVYQGIILTASGEIVNSGRNNNECTLEIEYISP